MSDIATRARELADEITNGATRTEQYAAGLLVELADELDRLRDVATGPYLIMDEREGIIGIVNATDYDEAWATFQAKNLGDYDGDPDDNEVVIEGVTLEWCDKVVDALNDAREEIRRLKAGGCARDQRTTQFCAEAVAKDAEIRRLTSELAAAQTPVVEWQEMTDFMGNAFWTCIRRPFMLRVQGKGWDLVAIYGESYLELDSGEETGDAGKAACIAAYYAAIGLPCP